MKYEHVYTGGRNLTADNVHKIWDIAIYTEATRGVRPSFAGMVDSSRPLKSSARSSATLSYDICSGPSNTLLTSSASGMTSDIGISYNMFDVCGCRYLTVSTAATG